VDDTLTPLVEAWLTVSEVGEQLGVSDTKVRQLLREHQLAAVRRADIREPGIPAAFVQGNAVVKGLPGTLTLLSDRGLSDAEAIEWLFTREETLPGRPIDALRENRGTEVRRRAQAIV
jgi:hypothetical protein